MPTPKTQLTDKQKKGVEKLLKVLEGGNVAILQYLMEIEERLDTEVPSLKEVIQRMKGDKGDSPTEEEVLNLVIPIIQEIKKSIKNGENYVLSDTDKEEIATLAVMDLHVPIVEKVIEIQKTEVVREVPIVTENVVEVAVKDTPFELRDKLETLKNLPDEEKLSIEAIGGFSKSNIKLSDEILNRAIGIVDQRTSFLINKVSNLQTQVNNINTTPVGGSGFQAPLTGVIDGVNRTFIWTTAPNVIVVDQGRTMQKTNSAPDSTVNWTGTTTTILAVAPTFDIFAIA